VDTVCSLGGIEVQVDEWGIDACVSGSQKCIGLPPGLALLSVSDRVLSLVENRKTPVGMWYGDIKNWMPIMMDPSKYFATPPVNMIYALSESLKSILAEGLENRFRRHHKIAEAFRAAMEALDLKLVAEQGFRADTLTAVYYPANIDDASFRNEMRKQGIIVASTIGPIKGKGFRVGHMGNVSENDILATIAAIETTLTRLGYSCGLGAGLTAAQMKFVTQ
jgi:alanine-glyoxylate transaminase/serine-glyoxylate transaminase/serine-pyruvate transaminase